MKRRFWLSAVMTTVGVSLLVATAFAGAATSATGATAKADARGGTLRVDSQPDFDYVDPALAYFTHTWQAGDAVNLKLLTYPDINGEGGKRLVPEAAQGLPAVSRNGRTYTFTIKNGFRFSNGAPVTAANFAAAINRNLNPKMQSPASSFIEDIVGAKAVIDGKAATASGVRAQGQKLTVNLTKVAPDFLARMTMNFFAAIPANLPINPDGIGAPMVSAGPYYFKDWVKNRSATAVRNPYWNNNKEPWKSLKRPANVDAIQWTFGNTLDATKLRIDKNETDIGGAPAAAYAQIAQEHGINKPNGRFFLNKNIVFWYLAMNNENGVFKGNAKLRQAVNWALDRPQLVRQHGYLGGGRTDQILPPGMPGYKDWAIYPLGGVNSASLTKAKALAGSGNKKAVFYAFNTATGRAVAQVAQFNLKQIGIDVEIKVFDRVVQHEKVGTRGEPFDMSHSGWSADYADPSNFINVLLDGTRLQATNNVNESYFNDPAFNRRMAQAATLSGDARLKAYGELDRDITKNGAPLATYINTNSRNYVSQSLGCYSFQAARGLVNLVGVCKK
jgi:peptide/nickel transport system substrate-binding protein